MSERRAAALTLAGEIAGEARTHQSGEPWAIGATPAWVGPDVVELGDEWRIEETSVPEGLYSGTAGIALALAAASRAGAGPGTRALAEAAARDAVRAGRSFVAQGRLDYASGAAGIAYAIAWTARLLELDDLAEESADLARSTAAAIPDVASAAGDLDFLTGMSGAVLATLAVLPADAHVVRAAEATAARIAGAAEHGLWGVCWPERGAQVGLLGLAHGTSGMALALVAGRGSGETDSVAVASKALEYERAWFEPHLPGWPDLRPTSGTAGDRGEASPGQLRWQTAWCHGALGIGLARAALLAEPEEVTDALGESLMVAETAAAIEAARQRVMGARAELRRGGSQDCTLCHGLAGPVELFLAASALGAHDEHLRAARKCADLLVETRDHLGSWPCGLPTPADTDPDALGPPPEPPGLFVGRAGIVLTLLRSDEPDLFPPVTLPRRLSSHLPTR